MCAVQLVCEVQLPSVLLVVLRTLLTSFHCDVVLQPPFKVIFVDDPRAFRKLKEVWPEAKLQQDAFHLTDRFSREVSPTNTLKGERRVEV